MSNTPVEICYRPIGVIHSPFHAVEGMPIQAAGAAGVLGTVEVFPQFSQGLQDLDGFSHVILIYHLHRSSGFDLLVRPFMDTVNRGVFATRAPKRPNSIGLSVVRLIRISEQTLQVQNVDVLDGTPLLDIKPYIPEFDHHLADRVGWFTEAQSHVQDTKADNRFQ